MFDIYDLTCGTAAFEAYLTDLADVHALMPYQGTKWRVRKELTELVEGLGFVAGEVDRVHLNDLGPWGMTWQVLLNPVSRPAIIQILVDSQKEDPQQLYDSMHGQPVPGNKVIAAAQYLWLQRLSFGNKAVGIRDGRWVSPGLNPSSAYGKPATDKFGAIKPMIPSLISRLRGYHWEVAESWSATQLPASAELIPRTRKPKLVFIDPPYKSRTKYPSGDLPRLDVAALGIEIAEERLRGDGLVMITESEPIPELIEAGWEQHRLSKSRHGDGSPMKGKHEEWVTYLRVGG